MGFFPSIIVMTHKGFTIYGADSYGTTGLYVGTNGNNCIVMNQTTGMYIYGDTNFVADNQCYLNKEDGLFIQSSYSLFVNNVFHSNDR
ncbi:MAG: hypothetical protein OMM_09216 [Candidatus Magnetoglobus multicellularis str. Araruama]|uniref:Uncharacterized protein n=1 Tax=Candidatus Magnetoglobus multicellularis str. Araruama TaxID=890399 RepID=A0A1V1P569_9BACT|nr:MAG: hypothetical protein OMM_09216 [Candidatus Magnetoglobus multicellularis str. Araruama]